MQLRKPNLPVIVAAILTVDCVTVSAQTVSILHSFNGGDGQLPLAGLVQGSDGNFYGTTFAGGAISQGAVFRLSPSGGAPPL